MKTRVFDYYNFFRMAAVVLVEAPGNPPLAIGDDHGAVFNEIPSTFEEYMESRLKSYFSTYGKITGKSPTLDSILAVHRKG
jgi:hypothetical protein